LDFENLQFFCHVTFVGIPFCFLVQNFAEIGQPFDELWPKNSDFQDGGHHRLEF